MRLDDFDPNSIADEQLRAVVKALLNVLEAQQAEIKALRDEIKRLKGEKSQPKFKASPQTSQDVSSESERRERRRQRKGRKHNQIVIVYDAFGLDAAERALIEQVTKYPYGEVCKGVTGIRCGCAYCPYCGCCVDVPSRVPNRLSKYWHKARR